MACEAIAQLTQLQRLRLGYRTVLADASLMHLSALRRLTSLEVNVFDHRHLTGSWLAALAAAQLPLRQLRLCMCDRGVRVGKPALRLADLLCACRRCGLASLCSRSR